MAKFSPQDLMNPMQKIASALEDVKKDTNVLVEVVSGSAQNTYNSLIVIEENVAVIAETLLNISKKMKLSEALKKKDKEGGISKSTKEGIELFKTFGIGVKEFAVGMLMFSIVPKKTAEKLVDSVQRIAESLSQIDKQVFDNATKLGEVGENIFKFTGWLVLAALLAVGAIIAIPLIATEIWLFSKLLGGKKMNENLNRAVGATIKLGEVGWSLFVFEGIVVLAGLLAIPATIALPFIWLTVWGITKILGVLTKNPGDILIGSALLLIMGATLIVFSISMLLFSLAAKTLNVGAILKGALLIGIIGMTCFILGQPAVFPYVMLGAIALTVMAMPLLIMAVSLMIFALSMKLVDDKMPGKMMKLIICLGLAFAAVGIVFPLVLMGGLAMTVASVALLVMGLSLLIWGLTLKILDKKAATRISTLLTTIGFAFAAIGVVALPIALGAIAMLLVGASLIVLGIGIMMFGLALKLLDDEAELRIPLILETLGGAYTVLGLLSIPIALGAAAALMIGVSLIPLSIGLMMFALALKVIDNPEKFNPILDVVLHNLANSYAYFGLLSIPVLLGASAMIPAALSLTLLSPALMLFQKVNWTEKDSKALSDAIIGVRNAFLGIEKGDSVFTILKKTAGAMAGSAALLAIVPGYIAAGLALRSIAKGLKSIKELSWDTEKDGDKLRTVITTISQAFASVADEGTIPKMLAGGAASKWGAFFTGFIVEKNKVKEGIDSVKGAGKALKDISEGLVEFTKWYDKNKKLLDTADPNSKFFVALKTTITSISSAFATIGGSKNFTENKSIFKVFKPEESLVQKGIDSVKGVGETLKDISEGVIKFTEWYEKAGKKKLDISNPNSPFFVALTTTLTVVSDAFATIGGSNNTSKSFGPFKWEKSNVKKGIEAVEGVGDALGGMLDGIIKFTDFYNKNKKDLESTTFENVNGYQVPKGGLLGALNITISAVGKAFASLGGEENEYSKFLFFSGNKVADGIEAVEGVDVALENIVKGLKTFIDAGITDAQVDTFTKLITVTGSSFGQLADVDIEEAGEDFKDFCKNFIIGLEKIYKKKEVTTRINTISSLLNNINRQVRFNTFHKAADGIKKIADAVNTIDVEKGKTFSGLFVAASKLKDNSKFYEDLKKAVEDIRDLLDGKDKATNTSTIESRGNSNKQVQQSTNNESKETSTKFTMPKTLKVSTLTLNADSVNLYSSNL